MTIIFDRTQALGDVGVMHAFIIGVSQYPHLPDAGQPPQPLTYDMKKLDAPARSAAEMARWLFETRDAFDKKLVSIHFLASPAIAEAADVTQILQHVEGWNAPVAPATLQNFAMSARDWRIRAGQRKDNATFFYFAGHGLERTGSQILALEDFGDPSFGRFAKAAMLQNIHAGMAPSDAFPDIARTQFYFVDACRTTITDRPGLTTTATSIFDEMPDHDDRVAPIFYASYPGQVALARSGRETAYLPILRRAMSTAAQCEPNATRWSVDSLTIFDMIDRLRKREKLGHAPPGDNFGRAVLLWLPGPPNIDFELTVRPDTVIPTAKIKFTHVDNIATRDYPESGQSHPYMASLPAGIYQVFADPSGASTPGYKQTTVIDYKTQSLAVKLGP